MLPARFAAAWRACLARDMAGRWCPKPPGNAGGLAFDRAEAAVQQVTLGVEEEFHVIDLDSRHLVSRGDEWPARLPAADLRPEPQRSMMESNSAVCGTLEQLGADLRARRGRLAAARRRRASGRWPGPAR